VRGASSPVTIRPLDPSEWETFREFRLNTLKTSPGTFSSTYERELSHSPERWQELVTGDATHQAFGLFDGASLVGITAVFTHRDYPEGDTAILAMSFIDPAYRGRGLSHLLYQARLDWVQAHPQFRRVIVGHRESNEISRRANQHFGFRYTGRATHTWPDGVTEDELIYELEIDRQSTVR
jgi:RimJ/RimL family protein N-acetyltransferase